MAENESKIIKFTITRLLAGREHSIYELLKKLLQRDLERNLCIEWFDLAVKVFEKKYAVSQ